MKRFNKLEIDSSVQKILRDLEKKYTHQMKDELKTPSTEQICSNKELIEINCNHKLIKRNITSLSNNVFGYLVPASKLGVIIGKNGDNLRFIAEQSNTRLNISPYNDLEQPHLRMIQIEGDVEDVKRSVELLETSIKTFQYHLVGSINNPGSIFQSNYITVEIPNNIVGTLLGKQSETLLKVHSKYGVQMALLKDEEIEKGSSTRPLLIGGRNKYIAKNEIESLIEKAKLSTVNFLDRSYKDEKIEKKYVLDAKLFLAFNKSVRMSLERKYNLIVTVKYETKAEFETNYMKIRGKIEDVKKAEKEINVHLIKSGLKLEKLE